jgi:sugar phosphate isomerase/epimerase
MNLPVPASQPGQPDDTGAKKLGWKLTLQSWTTNSKTLFESIDICKQLGIKYIEVFPGQKISSEDSGKFDPGMTDAQITACLDKAKACGVQIIDCGVINIPNNEKEARKIFDWAKKVGITILVSEPEEKALPLINKLAGEYAIKVAIHDHAKPSRYWNPEHVDAVTRDLPNVGFCADVGHWKRSGLNPVLILKKYGDKVFSVHFKDLALSEKSKNYHDVHWGKGECDAAGMLAALRDKGFKGPIAIEWESKWDVPILQTCVDYFHAEANKLALKAKS